MKRIEDYTRGERMAFYWPGEKRTVNALVLEPHVPNPNCPAYLIAIVTTPDLDGYEVLVENGDLREPFDEPEGASALLFVLQAIADKPWSDTWMFEVQDMARAAIAKTKMKDRRAPCSKS